MKQAAPHDGCERVGRRLYATVIDLDGTLVDSLPDFAVALNATLAELSLATVGRGLVEATVGRGSGHLLRRAGGAGAVG